MHSLEQVLEDGAGTDVVPGAVAAYATRDGVQFLGSTGFRCLASGDPMQPDAIFRIAPMTKATTSVAALPFVEAGRAYLRGRVGSGQRCCWPLNADLSGGAE